MVLMVKGRFLARASLLMTTKTNLSFRSARGGETRLPGHVGQESPENQEAPSGKGPLKEATSFVIGISLPKRSLLLT